MDIIRHRLSCRRFDPDRTVSPELITQCLEAARLAPSACNSQPWHFVVVTDPAIRQLICDRALCTGLYRMNAFCRQAPVLVAIVSEKMRFWAAAGSQARDTRYHLIDIGIAGEHFALRADELGLATCWLGWFDEKEVKKALDVPRGRRIDVMLALGYAAEDWHRQAHPRKSLEEMSSFESYQPGASGEGQR
ncbi:nitroreductase [Dehalogenimonas lykanthroporepellens BL-DC-9]|nr:nitroreductase [Dehalogenimonas lykanthroporepellens BL-DC-9]